jgi:hypothetical protein
MVRDLRRKPGAATIIKVFDDGTRELRMDNGRRLRVRFHRCPGCGEEKPESEFTMALCWQCRGVRLTSETRYECDKRDGSAPRLYRGKRYARRAVATPPWVDKKEINLIYAEAKRLTKETGVIHQVDHIWPLVHESFCGLHVPWNLRVVSKQTNGEKHNRPPLDFYQQIDVV